MGLLMTCLQSCCPEEKSKATILFKWNGTEDLLKLTHPIITWWNNPHTVDGETITSISWEKRLNYEDFDSIMVYAVVTYPRIEQLPDTVGQFFILGQILTAAVTAEGESGKITQITAIDGIDSNRLVRGGDLKNYLDSLGGVTDQIGFVIYRNGQVRNKEKYEELNWKK